VLDIHFSAVVHGAREQQHHEIQFGPEETTEPIVSLLQATRAVPLVHSEQRLLSPTRRDEERVVHAKPAIPAAATAAAAKSSASGHSVGSAYTIPKRDILASAMQSINATPTTPSAESDEGGGNSMMVDIELLLEAVNKYEDLSEFQPTESQRQVIKKLRTRSVPDKGSTPYTKYLMQVLQSTPEYACRIRSMFCFLADRSVNWWKVNATKRAKHAFD
jgi:hypothetical protein